MRISYGKNVYGLKEIEAVTRQLKKSTQMGNSVSKFEKKISQKFSKSYGLMVNSGSSAIMLALKVLNLNPGDEVITPCLNFETAVPKFKHGVITSSPGFKFKTFRANIIAEDRKSVV